MATTHAAAPAKITTTPYIWAITRLFLGWIFLWAFVDKLFGLGFGTPVERSWLNGGSPTQGFLANSATGPFEGFYKAIAGAAWADWLFMLGLLGIGIALLLGIGMRVAAGTGALMMVMMWTAVLPPENNPFMDDHLVYAIVLIGLAVAGAGDTLGLGRRWKQTELVKNLPILE